MIAALGDEPLTRKLIARFGNMKYQLSSLTQLYQRITDFPGDMFDHVRAELDALDRLLPDTYPFSLYEFYSPTEVAEAPEVLAGAKIEGKGFQAILDYLGYAETTVGTLEMFLPNAPRETEEQRTTASLLETELASARMAYNDIATKLSLEPAIRNAIDSAFTVRFGSISAGTEW